MAKSLLKLMFASLSLQASDAIPRTVRVQVQHAILTGLGDPQSGVDIFTGVPYAQPPVGKLRLQPPKAIQEDQGSRDVSGASSYACFGLGQQVQEASEDCLTLDIVRPSKDGNRDENLSGLPVYVFMHGGDFNSGDKSEYGGQALVKTSIQLASPMIYVAMNYRLSFLGFPNSKEIVDNNATNLGLLDQRLALKWVRDNIGSLGGDPAKVTIGGQNSGAASCAFHMIANRGETKGLFRGAVMHSGGMTTSSPVPTSNYTEWSDPYSAVLNSTGCNTTPNNFLCLQATPITKLVAAYSSTYAQMHVSKPSSVYMPIVDGNFLPDHPSTLLSQGKIASIPTLMGTTTNELINSIPIYSGIGTDSAIMAISQQMYPYVNSSTFRQLMAFYPSSKFQNIGPPLSGAQWSRAVALQNDIGMFCPLHDQALAMSESNLSTWKFRWNAVIQSAPVHQWEGVPQGSELPYIYPSNPEAMVLQSPSDQALANELQKRIVSFVSTLDPNSLDGAGDVAWPRFTAESQSRMLFQRDGAEAGGVGSHIEADDVDTSACAFIRSKNLEFLR